MLNILNFKLNNFYLLDTKIEQWNNKSHDKNQIGVYFFVSKERFNGIYLDNKNINILLYVIDKTIFKLIKSYFDLYSADLKKLKKFVIYKNWKDYRKIKFWLVN